MKLTTALKALGLITVFSAHSATARAESKDERTAREFVQRKVAEHNAKIAKTTPVISAPLSLAEIVEQKQKEVLAKALQQATTQLAALEKNDIRGAKWESQPSLGSFAILPDWKMKMGGLPSPEATNDEGYKPLYGVYLSWEK